MCVIMIAQKVRPTEEMIDKAWKANDDGGGIAWRENGEVHFEKGIMTLDRLKELMMEVPMPYVAHFRITSSGVTTPELTHPFVVAKDVPVVLEGRTKGGVFFHNGTWSGWTDKALDFAIRNGLQVPDGEWSDTRAMAWMISIHGPKLMELLPQQRGVYFSPKVCHVFTGPGWEEINGVWCSNDFFWKRSTVISYGGGQGYGTRVCHVGRCTNRAQAGKDICWDCEKKQQTQTTALTTTVNSMTKQENGGTTGGTTAPFAPPGTFLTLKEAEARYKSGDLSKASLKRFRREYDRMASKNPKAIAKATEKLRELTQTANNRYVSGRAH